MELSGSQDIEAPIDFVFDAITDFDGFTKQALRRGIDVARIDDLGDSVEPTAGMAWKTAFDFRGKRRNMRIKLTECSRPNFLCAESRTAGMETEFDVELVALSRSRTRLAIRFELKPQSLAARLLVQSLKLARGNLKKRLGKRLDRFAKQTEERYGAAG